MDASYAVTTLSAAFVQTLFCLANKRSSFIMNSSRLLSMLGLVLLLSGSVFGMDTAGNGADNNWTLGKVFNHMATIAVFVVIFCVVKLFAKGAIKLVLIVLVVGAFFVAFANQLGWFPEDIDNATKYGADKVGELRKKYHTTLPKDVSDMAT
eukprot:152398_1